MMASNSSRQNGEGQPSSSSTNSNNDVDLDPFLTMLETRLRNPYSSLDLVRALSAAALPPGAGVASSSSGSGSTNQAKQADNVRLVGRVFDRMADPIKLRSIVGLMGLEDDAKGGSGSSEKEELDGAIWEVLTSACSEDDDDDLAAAAATEDEWVGILSGLVRGVMYKKSSLDTDSADKDVKGKVVDVDPCRGKRCANLLRKIADEIINQKICSAAASTAASGANPASDKDTKGDNSDGDGINLDPISHFVPSSYSLLLPAEIQKYLPEIGSGGGADYNPHFIVNKSPSILQIDADNERRRADEEIKEMEDRERVRKMANQRRAGGGNGAAAGGRGNGMTAAGRGGRGAAAAAATAGRGAIPGRGGGRLGGRGTGRGNSMDTASLFMRSKKPQTATKAVLGRGTARAALGRGRGGGRMSSTVAGRGGGGRGTGRGAAASAVGGRSLGLPTKKVAAPGSARTLSTKRPAAALVSGAAAAAGGKDAAGGAAGASANLKGRAGRAMKAASGGVGGRSKMMMIDTAEVEGLNKEQKAREEKLAAATSGKSRKRKIMEAAAAEEAAKKSKIDAANAVESSIEPQRVQNHSSGVAAGKQTLGEGKAPEPVQQPTAAAPPPQKDWQELLSKSNKLSAEDRFRVERFFIDKYNPTPDVLTHKMKLNEEKKTDPETGQTIKETLYLELDYSTFGYKKTRKVKKK